MIPFWKRLQLTFIIRHLPSVMTRQEWLECQRLIEENRRILEEIR